MYEKRGKRKYYISYIHIHIHIIRLHLKLCLSFLLCPVSIHSFNSSLQPGILLHRAPCTVIPCTATALVVWRTGTVQVIRIFSAAQARKQEGKADPALLCWWQIKDQAEPLVAATETAVQVSLRELPGNASSSPSAAVRLGFATVLKPRAYSPWAEPSQAPGTFISAPRGWDAVFALQLHTRTTHKLRGASPSTSSSPLLKRCLVSLRVSLLNPASPPWFLSPNSQNSLHF